MPYVGNTDSDRRIMLDALSLDTVADLFADIPEAFRFPELDLPPQLSELDVERLVDDFARQNAAGRGTLSFLGAGAYNHFIPSVVPYLSSRGEFATAYTPYQPEASQGTLQAIFEYQSMLAGLLGMDVVNASHYDGATAVAEAAIMAVRSTRGRDEVVLSGSLHPDYIAVVETYLRPQAISIVVVDQPTTSGAGGPTPEKLLGAVTERTAAVIVQNPDFLGRLSDISGLADSIHERGSLLVVHIDPIATALTRSPGSLGADIVTGEGQPLGIPLSFGGPYLGLFASRQSLVRKMPGRLVGQTTDTNGQRGFVLTLNTREQHIRREKATSNICTNQGLMALRAAIHLSALGPAGLREVATLCFGKAHDAATQLQKLPGCSVNLGDDEPFFKEFVFSAPRPAAMIIEHCRTQNVIPGLPLTTYYPNRPNELLIAVTEKNSRADIDRLVAAIAGALGKAAPHRAGENGDAGATAAPGQASTAPASTSSHDKAGGPVPGSNRIPPLIFEISRPGRRAVRLPACDVPFVAFPPHLARATDDPLTLPEVSELDVVRHFTRLSQMNMSIDTNFYPLGSCTMKYNPKINEVAASKPGFESQHPLAPAEESQGALAVMYELQSMLGEISGFPAVGLQPAAGAQGELTGILMIRAYHESRGEGHRKKILVPDSAHGTNPATVTMAGYQAVEIPSDKSGNVDLVALREACDDSTAGLMITNPNTLGLFEERIAEVIEAVHGCGGQVYGDGANLNAIMGIVRPGDLGIDVMHFNLHKTFSTPHGGGGPGAGPVGAASHLAQFLPAPVVTSDGSQYQLTHPAATIGRLKAYHGNFGMLLRAYVYVRVHGARGIRAISENAVLNANYLKKLVDPVFPVRFDRTCMHEFVANGGVYDGIATMDVAKRLIDYGFHAPTVYFPLIVKDALMIEPTESETRETLDAFAAALAAIAEEAKTNPDLLHQAPVTTPLRRLDEVRAVRQLALRYLPESPM